MSESYFEKRKRELGLTGGEASPKVDSSFFERRKADLGLIEAPAMNTIAPQPSLPPLPSPQQQLQAVSDRFKTQQPQSPQSVADTKPAELTTPVPQQTRNEWMGEQRDKRKAATSSNPLAKLAARLWEPVASTIDAAQAYIPGLSSFQKGAGSALNIEADTAPSTGPAIVNKPAEWVGMLAGAVSNPSNISQNLVTAPYQAANALVQGTKLGSKLVNAGQNMVTKGANAVNPLLNQAGINIGSNLTGNLAQHALTGAVAGGIQGGVISGVRDETDADQVALNMGIGAALGGVGDAAIAALGSAAKSIIAKYRPKAAAPQEPTLGLPAPRQRGNANTAETPQTITPEYQFGLPEPSASTVARADNVKQTRSDLKVIDDEIRQLESKYERAIVEEYNYLKQSASERGGVQQGQLQTDADGNVIGRSGRISKNPLWYQEFHAANGKTPSNKDLYQLAKRRIDEGFKDEAGDIPSWKTQNGFDESMSALQGVRSEIDMALREFDPALNVTDSPLVSSELAIPKAAAVPDVTPLPKADVATPDLKSPAPLPPDPGVLGISASNGKGKFTHPEDTRTYIASKTDREPVDISKLANDFYVKNVDTLQRINEFDKFIERETGKKLSADERAYYLALNTRGADVTSNHILTERLVDHKGNVVGQSLKDVASQIPTRAYANFNDYLIAKHAITRMARGETVYNKKANMTVEKAEQKVVDYERTYPQFKEIADQLYAFDNQLGQSWLVDTGLIPPEMFAAWREANPDWSPNQRKFSELEKRNAASGAKRGFANQNNPVKKYSPTGSERDIIDTFESRIEYTDRYVKTARRNEVMQTVYKSILKNPDELDGFATILKREKLDPKQVTGENGIDDLLDSLDDEFNSVLRKTDLDKDNVISALIDGERVYMRVEDPALLDALTNLSPQGQNAVIEGARKVTQAFKMLTTGVNPIFGLTRNIFRDIPEAYVYGSKESDNPFRYAWDTLQGFVSVFSDGASSAVSGSRALQKVTPDSFKAFLEKQATLYKDYKAMGGGHSSPAASNRNLLKQSKRELLPQQKKGFGLIPRAYGAVENLNNALESGPRLGEFKRARESGGDSYASKVEGIFKAQDVTTNFKRSGQVVKDADAIIPYLNAAVQGLDKFVRAFKDRPIAVPVKALSVIAAPTIALYAMNHDNPAYQKLNNHTKDNFYLIPTEEGKFIKIPKPRELGVPFGGLLERAMRSWNDDDPEAFRDFANTARTMFAPPVIGDLLGGKNPLRSTIAGPLVDVSSNENFMGAPIVPGYLEGLSPKLQYDAGSSEVGKKIGDVLNVSPKQVDHLIRSYTGVLGQIGLPATTQGATVGETLTKQMTADSVFSTDASRYFYELKNGIDTQYADAKATGVIPDGYNDGYRKYLGDIAGQMADYTKALREVDNSGLSRAKKKDQKRELTDQRNDLARQAYIAVRDALKAASK